MGKSLCTTTEHVYYYFILPFLAAIGWISMTCILYIYFQARVRGKLKSSKTQYYLAVTFFITIYIYLIIISIREPIWCHNKSLYDTFRGFSTYLYALQAALLCVILVERFIYTFNETQFALSKCFIISFFSVIGLNTILCVIGVSIVYWTIDENEYRSIGIAIWLLSAMMYIIVVIWLNALFIYKLFTVHRQCGKYASKHQSLLNVVTKIFILCFISTIQIICNIIIFFVTRIFSSQLPIEHATFIQGLFNIADVFTNFLSVFLLFSYFGDWYMKLCGCCHTRSRLFWSNCVKGNEDHEQMEHTVMTSVSSMTPSPTSKTPSPSI